MATNVLNTIVKGAGFVFSGYIIGKLLGYVYLYVISKLGPSEYGVLSLATSIISLVLIVTLLGLDVAVLRYVPFYLAKNDYARVKGAVVASLKLTLSLSLVTGLIIFIFAPQIANYFFHNNELTLVLRILAFTLPLSTFGKIILVTIRAFKKIGTEVFITEFLERSIKIVLTLILLTAGFSLLGASVAILITAFIIPLIAFIFLEKKIFSIFSKSIKAITYEKELLIYSIPLVFTSFMNMIVSRVDLLMIGYFRTITEVGVYNIALPLSELMMATPFALVVLFIPIITEFYSQHKFGLIKKTYRDVVRWIFLINFPLFLLFFVFSPQILRILFGEAYVSGAGALTILVAGNLYYALCIPSNHTLVSLKKTKLLFFNMIFVTIINVILNYFLIPKYGLVGGAIATAIALLIGGSVSTIMIYIIIGVHPFNKKLIKIIIAGVISILIIYSLTRYFFTTVPLWGFMLMAILYGLTYLGILYLIKGYSKEDFEILKSLKKRILGVSGFIRN